MGSAARLSVVVSSATTEAIVTEFLNNLLFIFQRFDGQSAVDILLVTAIFFGLMYWLRDTQAMVLLRGVILIVVALVLLTSLADLPAFSWLVRNSIPALLLVHPGGLRTGDSAGPGAHRPRRRHLLAPERPRTRPTWRKRCRPWLRPQRGSLPGSTAP